MGQEAHWKVHWATAGEKERVGLGPNALTPQWVI
jgi:hypothetical protein